MFYFIWGFECSNSLPLEVKTPEKNVNVNISKKTFFLRPEKPAQLTVPFLFLEQKLATSQSVWDLIIFPLTLEVKHAHNIFPPAFPFPSSLELGRSLKPNFHRHRTPKDTNDLQHLA